MNFSCHEISSDPSIPLLSLSISLSLSLPLCLFISVCLPLSPSLSLSLSLPLSLPLPLSFPSLSLFSLFISLFPLYLSFPSLSLFSLFIISFPQWTIRSGGGIWKFRVELTGNQWIAWGMKYSTRNRSSGICWLFLFLGSFQHAPPSFVFFCAVLDLPLLIRSKKLFKYCSFHIIHILISGFVEQAWRSLILNSILSLSVKLCTHSPPTIKFNQLPSITAAPRPQTSSFYQLERTLVPLGAWWRRGGGGGQYQV